MVDQKTTELYMDALLVVILDKIICANSCTKTIFIAKTVEHKRQG